jgi:hypothetical protein
MDGEQLAAAKCPSCGRDVGIDEKFCAACGASMVPGLTAPVPPPTAQAYVVDLDRDARIGRARKWLMAISIITLITGFIFYAIGKSEVEKQIRDADAQLAGIDPAQRDELFKQNIGMTYAEAVAHDRGQVTLLLVINIGLSVVYLGLWFWARRNPLAATVSALLLFIVVIVANAAYEPKTLYQGPLIKILFIAALVKAIAAAQEERRLRAQLPGATVV